MAADVVALDRNIGDLAAIYVVQEVRKGEGRLRSPTGRGLEQVEKCDEKQPDHDPQGEILAEIVHSEPFLCRAGHRAPGSLRRSGPTREHFYPFRDKALPALNNSKACAGQWIDR